MDLSAKYESMQYYRKLGYSRWRFSSCQNCQKNNHGSKSHVYLGSITDRPPLLWDIASLWDYQLRKIRAIPKKSGKSSEDIASAHIVSKRSTDSRQRTTTRICNHHKFPDWKNVRLLKQPPYSPDCNLCDCYAFPRLESVRKSDFVVVHEIHDFLNEELPKFTALRMEKALKELEEHMERVIAASGDYV